MVNQYNFDFVFDYEEKTSYRVRIRATSSNGGYFSEKFFIINIKDEPDQIEDILITNKIVEENQSINTVIGSFSAVDQNSSASHSFELFETNIYTDNNLFKINDNKLITNYSFDFEDRSSYVVRVKATSEFGSTFLKSITISVSDLPDEIIDISIDNASIFENSPFNSKIGSFSTEDLYESATHTYSLIEGVGSDDNQYFYLNNEILRSINNFDFESKSSYSIRVRSTSSNGGYFLEKIFNITIKDRPDQIDGVTLNSSQIFENQPLGTSIGSFIIDDQDVSATHNIDIISGLGDWQKFYVDGNILKSNYIFDYETRNSYSVTLRFSSSSGYSKDVSFYILVLDDPSDNCDPNLSFNGTLNSTTSLSVVRTDSLNPDLSDYKIVSFPFKNYSFNSYTYGWRPDQYKIQRWNGTGYTSATGSAVRGDGYMFLTTMPVSDKNIESQ